MTWFWIVCLLCPIIPPSPFFERWIYCSNFKSVTTCLKCPKLVLTTYPSRRFLFANGYYQIDRTQLSPANISMLCQRCRFINMLSWHWPTSNQCWNNVVFSTSNQRCVFHRWCQTTSHNVETTLIFSTWGFTTFVNDETKLWKWPFPKITTSKIISNWIHWIESFNYYFIIFSFLFPILRGNILKNTCKAAKIKIRKNKI